MRIEADSLDSERQEETVLRGHVQLRRADQTLQADEVRVQRDRQVLEATGNVHYQDNDIQVTASRILQDDAAQQETYFQAQYQQHQPYQRVLADQIVRQGNVRTTLENARYSTCPPEEEAWRLEARNVVLDQDTGRGEARDATLYFQDTPILYTPYFNFPLDDRRLSGVLTPKFASGTLNGAELTVPYYFNLAENYDATLTPRLLSKRGLMLGGEFRYLLPGEQPAALRHEGHMTLEILPGDRAYLDRDRWQYRLAHRGQAPGGVNYDLQLHRVSDQDYLDTLSNRLGAVSTSFLDNRLIFSKSWESAAVSGLVQRYQTVNKSLTPAQEPYRREPQIAFSTWAPALPGGVLARLDGEYARFHHIANVTGERVDLYPSLSLPVRRAAWFVMPKAGWRHTAYRLTNTAPGAPTRPARTLPIVSFDGGLFFERDLALGGAPLVQTLEPRLYYLHIPYRDQSTLPVFDSGLLEFDFTTLFRENQFTGTDRVNDAHQISAGLTSRFLDAASGDEWLSLTAGQIYYFKNRRVTLPGAVPATADSSALALEGNWHPSRAWSATGALVWNPDTNDTEKGVLSLRYQPQRHRLFNASYRYRRGNLDQTDLSFLWPLHPQWRLAGRWNHDLATRQPLDTFVGLEYESCCFITRVLARSTIRQSGVPGPSGTRHHNTLYLELELKGLGSLGNQVERIFEEDILGYE